MHNEPLKLPPMADAHEELKAGNPILITDLGLGVLERLLNTLLDLEPDIREQLRAHGSLVIRIKTRDPASLFHVHLTGEGTVELSRSAPAPSRIRINASLLPLASLLLGNRDLSGHEHINVWGDADEVAWLKHLLRELRLRDSAQRWLRENLNLADLVRKIRGHDPSWITDLLPMPGMLREALHEIHRLRRHLGNQQEAWEAHRTLVQEQRRLDVGLVLLIVIALVLSLLPGDTLPARLAHLNVTHAGWLALLGALLFSRFWKR